MNCKFTKSYFDDSKPADSFWIKQPLVIEEWKIDYQCLLFKKSYKTGFWVSRNYLIYDSKLIKIKPNTRQCHMVNLNLSRIQKLKYENKQEKESFNKKKYGFRIIRNNQYRELYSRSKELNQQLWENLRKCAILTQFKDDYTLEKMVGKGNFAKVYQTINKETKKLYAVKAFEKSKIKNSETDRLALLKEMTVMRQLNHKGLIKMYEVYEDDSNVFFILEYLEGGELHNHIQKNQKFPEKVVAKILATILDSLDYLQKLNILHRDLKPDNLILRNKGILDDIVTINIFNFPLIFFINQYQQLFQINFIVSLILDWLTFILQLEIIYSLDVGLQDLWLLRYYKINYMIPKLMYLVQVVQCIVQSKKQISKNRKSTPLIILTSYSQVSIQRIQL